MTRSNPPSRPTRGAWRLLALAALGAAACGDSIASIEQTAGRAGPAEEPAGAAASSSSANSAAQLDTAAAQVVEGGLGEPRLDPAAYVQGDSIVRDSVVVGHLSQDTTSGSVAPISGLPPGHCLVLIYYYLDTGEIIGYTILHCEPSEEDPGGSGRGSSTGNEPTDTTSVTIGLDCPANVNRGARAACTITKYPSDAAVINVQWTFTNTAVTNTKQNGESWVGTAVSTGTVKVTGSAGGHSFTLTRSITVQDRGWRWTVSTGWAVGSEVDACRGGWGREAGRVAPTGCGSSWFDKRGFTIGQGSGPWARLHFVSGTDAPLELLAALHPQFRANGPEHWLRGDSVLVRRCKERFGASTERVSTHQANTQCDSIADYPRAISFVRAHENRHLSAAASAAHTTDLYAMWDTVVTTSREKASSDASKIAEEVHRQVESAMRATHTGGTATYTFWRFSTSHAWHKNPLVFRN